MQLEQTGTDDFRLAVSEYELIILRNALSTDLDMWGNGPFDFEGAHELIHDTRELADAITKLLSFRSSELRGGPVLVSERW